MLSLVATEDSKSFVKVDELPKNELAFSITILANMT
jgi:hypothetical protein